MCADGAHGGTEALTTGRPPTAEGRGPPWGFGVNGTKVPLPLGEVRLAEELLRYA